MFSNQIKPENYFKALFQHANKLQKDVEEKEKEKKNLEEKHEKERSIMEAKNAEVQRRKEELEASLRSACQYDDDKWQRIKPLRRQLDCPKDDTKQKRLEYIYYEILTERILPKFEEYLNKNLTFDTVTETEPVTRDEWDTKDQYKIYGLLLNACKVKALKYTDIENEAPGEEVEIRMSLLDKSKLEVLTSNVEAALSLTFQMLKLLPPLVVCQPWKYHEGLQDTDRVAWDEEKEQEAELIYYRPVLVYGNHLHVAVKGLVGNKSCGTISRGIVSRGTQTWIIQQDEILLSEKKLGSGAYGYVCEASFRDMKVAAKCLHEVIVSEYNISIFNREMQISSCLCHPNLVQFIGATQDENPIILTELMTTPLRKVLERNKLENYQIMNISLDVCAALNYLHQFKPDPILHRDVSSANVLLNPSGPRNWVAKLADFGSANFLHHVSPTSVGPGAFVYAAPESNNPMEHSPAMDVYSFGVLLMEMSLHQLPSSTTIEREQQARNIKTPIFKVLVQKCLQHEKDKRPHILDVIQELKTYM